MIALLFSATVKANELSDVLKKAQIVENAVAKCAAEIRALLLPFGAKAGFPNVRPQGLENASYQQLYRAAARKAAEGSQVMADFINSNKLPTGVEFSARYFMKRLEIASHEYADQSGNEKVFEFLCKDFASACDKGFEELRFWEIPEMLTFDNIWHKNIQDGFVPVKEKLQLVRMPSSIAPDKARETWKQAAQALSLRFLYCCSIPCRNSDHSHGVFLDIAWGLLNNGCFRQKTMLCRRKNILPKQVLQILCHNLVRSCCRQK